MAVLGNLGTMFVRDKNGQMVPVPVIRGEDGGFYTPEIKDGVIRWAASRPDMPEVPDMNIGTGGGGGTPDAVQFVPQELTDRQQAQARENIGAARIYTLKDGETIDDAPEDADIVWDPEKEGEGAGTGGGTVDLTEVHERIDALENEIENLGGTLTEPAEDDIPKVFFGGALQQTKDEAVVPFRYISRTQDISGYAEIKAQGNSSMNYPKKNQTVKLFKDAECTEKLKVDFKGWGKQNKHVYKANWIDLSHARNVVSARLWGDVVKTRANYAELPELFRTTPNQGAVDGFPVKVYAAGVYQGRYTMNIPKDKWTFNMDDDLDEHCVLCGENYKSGCFRAAAKIDESDWTDEIHDTVPESIKTRWNQVISFVMSSTDDEFKSNLGNYFYIDSLIDYYLFGLVSCGLDAFGKNQIYATYDGQKWIASMYDMDSTWGLYWNGSKFVATDYARTSYEDFVSTASDGSGNLLYIRLEQLFYAELQSRWAELKSGALSIDNIINRFERFTDIAPPELVKEDYASTTGGGKFTGIPSQNTNNIQQIRSYALARHSWTDTYVAGLTPEVEVPCTGITLDNTTLTFTGTGTKTITATVTPDGCTDTMVWVCSNPAVAVISVDGNVCTVEAIANGNATITATCGEFSASCSVAVSGMSEAVACTGITLDKTELTFTADGSQTIVATVTPTDTTDKVVWSSDNESVATVENGVVTAIADGSCTITATCGNYSASCAVNVSGVRDGSVLYTLAEERTFNGTTDYIDTGIQLFDTDKDFTITFNITPNAQTATQPTVIGSIDESIVSYPGISFFGLDSVYKLGAAGNVVSSGIATTDTNTYSCALIHEAGSGKCSLKMCSRGHVTECSCNIANATHTKNLLIGCFLNSDGALDGFWSGVMHSLTVWSRVLSDEEISEYLGVEENTIFHDYYIDVASSGNTGVKLYTEDIDFTMVYDAVLAATPTGATYFITNYNTVTAHVHPTQGFFGQYFEQFVGIGDADPYEGVRYKFVFTHTKGTNTLNYYLRYINDSAGVDTVYTQTVTGTFAAKTSAVTLNGSNIVPTVDEFAIYNYAMTEDEARAWLAE